MSHFLLDVVCSGQQPPIWRAVQNTHTHACSTLDGKLLGFFFLSFSLSVFLIVNSFTQKESQIRSVYNVAQRAHLLEVKPFLKMYFLFICLTSCFWNLWVGCQHGHRDFIWQYRFFWWKERSLVTRLEFCKESVEKTYSVSPVLHRPKGSAP